MEQLSDKRYKKIDLRKKMHVGQNGFFPQKISSVAEDWMNLIVFLRVQIKVVL